MKLDDTFQCPGYRMVEDRKIRCHKVGGHGTETFVQGVQNSCNPVFIDIGLRLGVDKFCEYFKQFGLLDLTGVDLPGEAGTIMHKKENIGAVELATMSFGQSFQITPVQMATTVSSLINGGVRVTPHFGMGIVDREGEKLEPFSYPERKGVVSKETSATILGMAVIHDPQGIYYGGTIAAPVIRDIFDNILPYMGIERGPVSETKEEE